MKAIKKEFKSFMMLRPSPDLCQTCAWKHEPEMPHNRDTLYYQTKFKLNKNRWPTWVDAMAHCEPEMKKQWKKLLIEKGVKI